MSEPRPEDVVTMLKGFVIRIEDSSRGCFSDEAAHGALAAIHGECLKTLELLDRPDLMVRAFGGRTAAPVPFDPLNGASRGVGRCTCPCGRGTDPSCPVHP